jgi:hypothetical protein
MNPRHSNTRIRNSSAQVLEVPRSNYAYLEMFEKLEDQKQELYEIKSLLGKLIQQNAELKVAVLEQKNTGHFTVDDVEKYFDISARLQQQDRTAKKLGYLKKIDGAKILYTEEHLKEYFEKEFEDNKAIHK